MTLVDLDTSNKSRSKQRHLLLLSTQFCCFLCCKAFVASFYHNLNTPFVKQKRSSYHFHNNLINMKRIHSELDQGNSLEDIEDCCEAYYNHSAEYHKFSDAETIQLRCRLLGWYAHHRRKLPWRGDLPPYNSELSNAGTTTGSKENRRKKHKAKTAAQGQRTLDSFLSKNENKKASKPKGMHSETELGRLTTKQEKYEVSSYGTWVSEVMLQQTQVGTVINYYNKWMERFPTLEALAAASLEEVNSVWAGLGYYSRAKRLHEGAQYILREMDGKIPNDPKELLKIPGIGPYTAGAIASISFNKKASLVDGNVIRVFSRLRAIDNTANNSSMVKLCWELADTLVDPEMPGDFNQGLMELGATICTPQNPVCGICPLKDICKIRGMVDAGNKKGEKMLMGKKSQTSQTAASGRAQDTAQTLCSVCVAPSSGSFNTPDAVIQFPRKKEKKAKPLETYAVIAITAQQVKGKSSYLLLKRPEEGLLAGQWEFPSLLLQKPCQEGLGTHRKDIVLFLENKFGLALIDSLKYECTNVGTVHHVFSHKKHEMRVQQIVIESSELVSHCLDNQQMEWMDAERMRKVGLTTNMRKVLGRLD